MLQEFTFNTGVKPFDFTPPAGLAFIEGFRDSGNGVYVIPFYCKDVPPGASFKHASDHFEKDTKESLCREIFDSPRIMSKYAHFII